jgi:hypothetical protein
MNKYKVTQAEKEAAHAIARRAARRAWNNIHGEVIHAQGEVKPLVVTPMPACHKPNKTRGITLANDMSFLNW